MVYGRLLCITGASLIPSFTHSHTSPAIPFLPFCPPQFLSYGVGLQGQLGWRPQSLKDGQPREVMIPPISGEAGKMLDVPPHGSKYVGVRKEWEEIWA